MRWKQQTAVTNSDPQSAFRGLPLTAEQDAEVRHYIKVHTQHDLPWDTPELSAMLRGDVFKHLFVKELLLESSNVDAGVQNANREGCR